MAGCAGGMQRNIAIRTRFAIRPLHLKTSSLPNISNGEGRAVVCLEGSVWITHSNDTRDVALIAG
jgi:Protein of unknown function (DUF2917)